MAMASIPDLHGAQDIWFRENLKPGYVPFSEPPMNPVGQKNSVSAEAYCASDVLNYDNYDAIYGAQLNTTYYCIAFNSIIGGTPTTTPANTPPTIALTGSSTMTITVGDAFVDLGATATDTEDGDLTSHVITTGSVNTSSAGTYVLTYTVTDSGGLSTSTTRTVIVQTSGDGGPSTNTPPVITILGDNPLTININTDFVDPGATSSDAEDGDLTANIIASSTVSTTTVGTYTVTYTVTDSAGATTTATRTVNVVDNTDTGCVTDCGGGGGGGSGTNGGPNLGTGGGGGGSPFFASSFGSGATINGPLTCPLLNSYLRYGDNNDPTEVLKLQAFLQRNQGLDVDVTGTFDLKTLAGVNAFQTKYLGEVMGPWDATRSSGYVYITTKKKVNEIACATAFIINPAEQAIIDAYKAAQNGTGPLGPQNTSTTSPDIGFNATSSNVASGDFFNNPNTAGVANASILARFWAFLKSLFGFGS